jgi:tRNA A-37 threonylcarbamoyl transferase component Bud32
VFSPGAPGGALTVHPAFAESFARLGLTAAGAFLDLPGEVVSGHPDRHVVRVELPGCGAFYLKRQHVVGRREKRRNRAAGYGRVSRCEREAALLRQLGEANLPAPRWAAFGTHGGRAFLLVEEVPRATDLRQLLSDGGLSLPERRALAENLGRAVAAIHAAGFATPDLTAKHVLVDPRTLAVTFLDWQSATRSRGVSEAERAGALGALHASLAGALASPRERLGVLRAYGHTALAAKDILRASARHAKRRSIRDQLQLPSGTSPQRLVWLAGEAVCAVPEVAEAWPRPAVAPPFYGFGPDGESQVRFAGRNAVLVRGRASAPLGRLVAWLRAAPWRSPGVTIGRVLFHLERYGVPAPRLLAFGQQLTTATAAEWFALYETPPGVLLRRWRRTAASSYRRALLAPALECVRKLHDAGCVLADVRAALAVNGNRLHVADPRAVRIVRRVSRAARRQDIDSVTRLLGVE